MTVYIVVTTIPYETRHIESVWLSKDAANREAARLNRRRWDASPNQDDIETDVEDFEIQDYV